MRFRLLLVLLVSCVAMMIVVDLPRGTTQPPSAKKGKNARGDSADASPIDKKILEAWAALADWEFKRRDKDGDGRLQLGEMPGKLRDELAIWDRNKDEQIDLAEFREHFSGHMRQKAEKEAEKWAKDAQKWAPKDAPKTPTLPTERSDGGIILRFEESSPVVWRHGKLPANLPSWFGDLDKNKDGQVAMYEWTRAGKTAVEFLRMDENDDGLLTAGELLRFLARTVPAGDSRSPALGTAAAAEPPWKAKKEKKEKEKKEKKDKKEKG